MIQNKTIIRWVEQIATIMGRNKNISYDPQKVLERGFNSLSNELQCRRWYAGIPFIRYRIDPVEDKSYWIPESLDRLPKVSVDDVEAVDYIMGILDSYSHPDNIIIRVPTQLDASHIKKFWAARGELIRPFWCGFGIEHEVPPYRQIFDISGSLGEIYFVVMPIIEQEGFSDIFSDDEEVPIEIVDTE